MPGASLKFDDMELDLGSYQLRRNGSVIKLERIPMDLLIMLADRNGQLVSREEIIEKLWGKDVFVDSEHGVNTAVRKVRNALQDDPENPRFIETVVGKGYRFVAPLATLPEEQAFLGTSNGYSSNFKKFVLLGACVLAALSLGAYLGVRYFWPAGTAGDGRSMLAVLPFENLTGDPDQEYFSDGMTEEMIATLGRAGNQSLGVIARTSSMRYKNSGKGVEEIGRELRVDYVLEGSVRLSGSRVRVTAQLIKVRDQSHLWAQDYDSDVFRSALVAVSTFRLQITLGPTRGFVTLAIHCYG